MNMRSRYYFLAIGTSLIISSCTKIIEIDPPKDRVVSEVVFSTPQQANSAVVGLYSQMIASSSAQFSTGAITIFCGLSADELKPFSTLPSIPENQFYQANISAVSQAVTPFWTPAYSFINSCNVILEGLNNYGNLSDSLKNQLMGEVKFIRAFCYFYLTNLFGDVPLPTTANWRTNSLLPRATKDNVYALIISDLNDAVNLLPDDYTPFAAERVRANRWAAKALLARVYLFQSQWNKAEVEASDIIGNTNLFTLSPANSVFTKNNSESILQLYLNSAKSPFNGTVEGRLLIPRNNNTAPYITLSAGLLAAFESGDQRRATWTKSYTYQSNPYTYPYKYNVSASQVTVNGTVTQYYMLLRLAEQYLIRAEARAMQNNIIEAIDDLNVIRRRAALSDLSTTLTLSQVLNALEQERKVEFFAEWGHRWLDLKRWNKVDAILAPIKGNTWQSTDQLYPIPASELRTNPNLTQNPGYQ